MYRRLIGIFVLWVALSGAAFAQETGIRPVAEAAPGQTSFQLKGVLISQSSRTALINGRMLQEGDRLGGIEIVSIEQSAVRVATGSGELSVSVGATFAAGQVPNRAETTIYGEPAQHIVRSGETLSEITQHYLRDGVTMDQLMVAMFDANPHAFSGNINVIYEGATLRIPDAGDLEQYAPAMATAEVARQVDTWSGAGRPQPVLAMEPAEEHYGPVETGETLSEIAADLAPDGVSMDQMMVAMFDANPEAFSGNINVLLEGAVLRIPGAGDLARNSRAMASAEVLRQTKRWRMDAEEPVLANMTKARFMAAGDEPIPR